MFFTHVNSALRNIPAQVCWTRGNFSRAFFTSEVKFRAVSIIPSFTRSCPITLQSAHRDLSFYQRCMQIPLLCALSSCQFKKYLLCSYCILQYAVESRKGRKANHSPSGAHSLGTEIQQKNNPWQLVDSVGPCSGRLQMEIMGC